jgi:hypothetical protein
MSVALQWAVTVLQEWGTLMSAQVSRTDRVARDLNWPNSERGVGHLEALGNALGEVASTTTRPGGHGNEEKNEFPRRICGGLSHMGSV